MSDKILFVDDDESVLDGYQRMCWKRVRADTAMSGASAIALIANNGPYAAAISDMRMPGMDGIQFLTAANKLAPDTVRVILTGHADLHTALDAVNRGQIFRFLTKPCTGRELRATISSCIERHHLVIADKELLDKTVIGCIEVLTDLLSFASPVAFNRAVRIRRYVLQLASEVPPRMWWKAEMAALLSQLGCVALDPGVIDAGLQGREFKRGMREAFKMHPRITSDLLRRIPVFNDIAWIISQQLLPFGSYDEEAPSDLKTAAQILRVAIAFEELKAIGLDDTEARSRLSNTLLLDPESILSLSSQFPSRRSGSVEVVPVSELSVGAVILEDVRTDAGTLVVIAGEELTYPMLVCLRSFRDRSLIPTTARVRVSAEK